MSETPTPYTRTPKEPRPPMANRVKNATPDNAGQLGNPSGWKVSEVLKRVNEKPDSFVMAFNIDPEPIRQFASDQISDRVGCCDIDQMDIQSALDESGQLILTVRAVVTTVK
jgi:hypothetical protein